MNKKERIRAAISGETPDKLPYSLWSHFPEVDRDAEKLAQQTYDFYKEYDVDFVKTMNNGMYAIEDFGCEVDYSEISKGGIAKLTYTPIKTASDWDQLKVCPIDSGSLQRELRSLELLLDMLKGEDVPVVFTVFSPITIAEKLSGKQLISQIESGHGPAIHRALEVITQTTEALTKKAISLGADGIFMASQMSTYDAMSVDAYLEYGKPYDLRVFQAAEEGWFNTLHAHGDNIMFEVLRDYPVDVFNWHAWETLPAIDEAYRLTGKCLMGGLKRMDITNGNKNELQHQIYECVRLLGGKNQILTPGCVIRYPLDVEMLSFVKRTKEYVELCYKKLPAKRPVLQLK